MQHNATASVLYIPRIFGEFALQNYANYHYFSNYAAITM